MTKPLIDQLVDRFLSCPLPEGVKADPCACNPNHPHRTGTNLLTAAEAKRVLEHVLEPVLIKAERYALLQTYHSRLDIRTWTGRYWEPLSGDALDDFLDRLAKDPRTGYEPR